MSLKATALSGFLFLMPVGFTGWAIFANPGAAQAQIACPAFQAPTISGITPDSGNVYHFEWAAGDNADTVLGRAEKFMETVGVQFPNSLWKIDGNVNKCTLHLTLISLDGHNCAAGQTPVNIINTIKTDINIRQQVQVSVRNRQEQFQNQNQQANAEAKAKALAQGGSSTNQISSTIKNEFGISQKLADSIALNATSNSQANGNGANNGNGNGGNGNGGNASVNGVRTGDVNVSTVSGAQASALGLGNGGNDISGNSASLLAQSAISNANALTAAMQNMGGSDAILTVLRKIPRPVYVDGKLIGGEFLPVTASFKAKVSAAIAANATVGSGGFGSQTSWGISATWQSPTAVKSESVVLLSGLAAWGGHSGWVVGYDDSFFFKARELSLGASAEAKASAKALANLVVNVNSGGAFPVPPSGYYPPNPQPSLPPNIFVPR